MSPSGLAPSGIPPEARRTAPARLTGDAYSGLISGSPGPNSLIASGPVALVDGSVVEYNRESGWFGVLFELGVLPLDDQAAAR